MPTGIKRASADASSSQDSHHVPKKTRFVEPNEGPVNFADQVDSALENPSARRKGRVKQEGYESDSSDDGEGVVLSRKKAADAADEDEDMFTMGDKEEMSEEAGGKKKKEEYLRLGDIEGQEFREENEDSDLDESDEPEDEDDAERRTKVGMGYELSSFNMKEEMEEGKFTEDGMYVRTFDPHGVHDRWMDGLDEKDIKLARRHKKRQEKIQQEKIAAEERELEESGGKGAMEMRLLGMLRKGESVLDALQRLGAHAKKVKGPKKSAPLDIDEITHLASNLMSLGDTDIYSKTYEELVRDVRRSGAVHASWVPPSADVTYEYKWDVPQVAGQDAATFGPYSEDEMKAWYKASYFGPTGDKVKVRTVGGEWGDWDDIIV